MFFVCVQIYGKLRVGSVVSSSTYTNPCSHWNIQKNVWTLIALGFFLEEKW